MGKDFRGGARGGRGGDRGGRGGRGGGRGGRGGVGFKKPTTNVTPHRHAGIFVARGKEESLVTLNMVPGESVYGEKRVPVEVIRRNKYRLM